MNLTSTWTRHICSIIWSLFIFFITITKTSETFFNNWGNWCHPLDFKCLFILFHLTYRRFVTCDWACFIIVFHVIDSLYLIRYKRFYSLILCSHLLWVVTWPFNFFLFFLFLPHHLMWLIILDLICIYCCRFQLSTHNKMFICFSFHFLRRRTLLFYLQLFWRRLVCIRLDLNIIHWSLLVCTVFWPKLSWTQYRFMLFRIMNR